MSSMWIYPLIGLFAGCLAGMFGIGGGIVVVPLLVIALGWLGVAVDLALNLAVGTSLATIAVTSLSSARAHYRLGNVRSDCLWPLLPGLALGAVGGVFLGDALSGRVLSLLIGIFFLALAGKLLLDLKPAGARQLPGRGGMAVVGAVVGAASAIFGIGGGVLTVPFLESRSVPMRQAVGTSAAAGIPIAVVGAVTAMFVGHDTSTLAWASGYVYWPAFLGIVLLSVPGARLGAAIASKTPASVLKRIFSALLIAVGMKFLLG